MDRIHFLNTNTSRVADSGATVASRGTIMGGSAAKNAAEKVRITLLEVGAEMTGDAVSDLDLLDNYLINIKTKKPLASFNELATACFNKGKPMVSHGWHHHQRPLGMKGRDKVKHISHLYMVPMLQKSR